MIPKKRAVLPVAAPTDGFLSERTWRVTRRVTGRVSLYLVLALGLVIFVAPMYWLAASSLKPEGDVFEYPPNFLPSQILWSNYPEAIASFPLVNSLKNSAFIIVTVELGRLLTASMAAFVFARIRFPFRDKLFLLVLSTMMIPYHVTLVPQYLIFRDLNMLDTPYPLILPNLFGGGAFFVFLLRQFFLTIPQDYDDAARIDGCGNFGIYWRIIMPISLPALGAVAIFTFMWTWEDFLGPVIYLNTPDNHTVSVAYVNWQRKSGMTYAFWKNWNHIMAMGTVITLPPVLVFFFAQRYFIQGVVVSGIKG